MVDGAWPMDDGRWLMADGSCLSDSDIPPIRGSNCGSPIRGEWIVSEDPDSFSPCPPLPPRKQRRVVAGRAEAGPTFAEASAGRPGSAPPATSFRLSPAKPSFAFLPPVKCSGSGRGLRALLNLSVRIDSVPICVICAICGPIPMCFNRR